jgi:hypothetical protein
MFKKLFFMYFFAKNVIFHALLCKKVLSGPILAEWPDRGEAFYGQFCQNLFSDTWKFLTLIYTVDKARSYLT